jgi:predicted RNA polymerase sigma factor
MELNASRAAARIGAAGEPVLILDQDRRRWDQLQIRRGLKALARARELGGAKGSYALQAAIVACHAQAREASETDWPRIAALYAELASVLHSPVVELNRAIAVSMATGAEAGLAIVERLIGEPALRLYHLLPSVHGDLLHRLGRYDEARAAFEAAATLAGNRREQELLRRRAAEASEAQCRVLRGEG